MDRPESLSGATVPAKVAAAVKAHAHIRRHAAAKVAELHPEAKPDPAAKAK